MQLLEVIIRYNRHTLAPLLALFLFSGEVEAGDKEDILRHMSNVYAAINAGDVDSIPFTPFTRFEIDGGLLSTYSESDLIKRKEELKTAFAAGLKVNVQTVHENVEVYGTTAVLTAYEKVDMTPPGADPINHTSRVTIVLVKEKDEWKVVHVHLSYLNPVNP